MIRIGLMGYGNLGRGVEAAIKQNDDMELVAVFSRRAGSLTIDSEAQVVSSDDISKFIEDIDVVILAGGSATDLPTQTPDVASMFNYVDSFDTHACIPEHYATCDEAAKKAGKVGLISCGWDPGLFSLARIYAGSVLPAGDDYTFWGRGVSQGHSDAIRRIPGVVDARQYTVPIEKSVNAVRAGEHPELTARDKHRRECYVVVEPDADKAAIEQAIVTMPYYFDEYDTTVEFISEQEMVANHSALPHGGSVIRSGKTGASDNNQIIEFKLDLDSNPEFTGSVLCACARAVYRLSQAGETGCKTLFDVPPAYFSVYDGEYLRAHLL